MSFVGIFFGFIMWFVISILLHEYGHYFMAKKLGYNAVIKGFSTFVTPTPKGKDDFYILLAGWSAGFIMILIYVLSTPEWLGLLMIALYLFGTRTDLIQIWGFRK
jgi:hypothetical protein